MTKTEIKTFTESLLDGNTIPDEIFDTFLNIAQSFWENRRPWVILRSEDSSQTISAGDTFTTPKNLPTDFRKWYTRFPLELTDSSGNVQWSLAEIPMNLKNQNKDTRTRFYVNYKTKQIFLCGTAERTLTINQHYLSTTENVSTDDNNEWIFPTEYHPILGLSVAIYYKLGIDYDIINNNQANEHATMARGIFESMTEWDAELSESALNGQAYGYGGGYSSEMGGNLSNLI